MPTTYAVPNGRKVFTPTLYTGNGSTQTVSNVASGTSGFQPDLVWTKDRTAANWHTLTDSVRGTTKQLYSNDTTAQSTSSTYVTAFNTNGFSLGNNNQNTNGDLYIGWQWQAGQGTTSTNTAGTITSTVSVNQTAGFSIVQYTGNGVDLSTIGHGLGTTPVFRIIKNKVSAQNWVINTNIVGQVYMFLNTTDAAGADNQIQNSTVFSVGSAATVNQNGDSYIAYCWAPVPGFSQFGSYTGNGSANGPFIYTGFKPAFIMIKQYSSAGESWYMWDAARSPYNSMTNILVANVGNAETTNAFPVNALSNGFQIPTTWTGINGNGTGYIYMAFAENPSKYANAR